ncbi:hypothetical protein J2T17_004397 [Paenibacillus mucilaginosus]|uniref:hypothetical protein n=1 Tax=Paenibacillus mucilaginosus TaxID=61624 RepID=UPI003D1E7AFC
MEPKKQDDHQPVAASLLGSTMGMTPAEAAIKLDVIGNGHKITFPDTQPYIGENSRALVPFGFYPSS